MRKQDLLQRRCYMTSREKHIYLSGVSDFAQASGKLETRLSLRYPNGIPYDPELLYVECHHCGKPVIWEKGRTTELLLAAGVDLSKLDERCLIVSEGCPSCSPLAKDGYTLAVVRIAGLTPEEAVHMSRPGGTA